MSSWLDVIVRDHWVVPDPPKGLWRVPIAPPRGRGPVGAAHAPVRERPPVPRFCLHPHLRPSAAGQTCSECGTVVPDAAPGAAEPHRPPIIAAPDAAADAPLDGARREWDVHIARVTHQPAEVLQSAWLIFRQVYVTQGAVSGNKARALVLVSLLYSHRLLHGTDRTNEEYLLKSLAIPSRTMNKAFTLMASVRMPEVSVSSD